MKYKTQEELEIKIEELEKRIEHLETLNKRNIRIS